MKTLLYLSPPCWQAEVTFSVAPQLKELGWELVFDKKAAHDLLCCHQDYIGECLLDYCAPIAVLERIDGCQLSGPVRNAIGDKRIRIVLKSSTFADLADHNQFSGRRFVEPHKKPKLQIAAGDLAKIRLGFSYAARAHVRDHQPPPETWNQDRDVRCSFAGTVEYAETPAITEHRQSCVDVLGKIEGCKVIDGRKLDVRKYWELLGRSVAAVCPHGCGEVCIREYEAALTGCLLIRPDFGYRVATPEKIYDVSCRYCKPDWSDLEQQIADAVDTHTLFAGAIKTVAAHVQSMNTPEAVAKRLAGYFEEAMG